MNPALDSRARFEAWAKAQPGYQPGHLSRWSAEARAKEGQYCDPVMEFAWQAAIASMAAEREKLERFLNAAAGEGYVLDGVDAADLYVALFPAEYLAVLSAALGEPTPQPPIAALAAKETT